MIARAMTNPALSNSTDQELVKSPVTQLLRHEELLRSIIAAEEEGREASPGRLAKEFQVTERTLRRMVTRLKHNHYIDYDHTERRYRWKGRKKAEGPGAAEQLTAWDIGIALLLAGTVGQDHPSGRQLLEHLKQSGVPTHLLSSRLPLSSAELGRGIERVDDDIFRAILGAAATGRALKGYYRKAGRRVSHIRRFVPRHICLLSGRWTAISYDFDRKEHRNFLIARFTSPPSFDELTKMPQLPSFDIDDYLAHDFGRFHGDQLFEVTILFEHEAAISLHERRWCRDQEIELLEDGRARLRCIVTHLADMSRWILSWRGAARVEAPEDLRKMVADEARRILTAHKV